MKIRADIVGMYRDVHGWIGIVCGLALFIAFYAGALTMFEDPLRRWASPPSNFGPLTPLANTPELIEKAQQAYPDARGNYRIVLRPSASYPARLSWEISVPGAGEHDLPILRHASLGADGALQVADSMSSPVSHLINELHQQIGLPFEHEIAMPIMGMIALLYGVALVSGVIVLLPTLIKDLFAFRFGGNLKRMWLDLHNLLGVFSLPFHIIMALTAVTFAYHDQFYGAQEMLLYRGGQGFITPRGQAADRDGDRRLLTPAALLDRLREQAPEFEPRFMDYQIASRQGPVLRIFGDDRRYAMRSSDGGAVGIDPYTGEIIATDYMPELQDAWGATITGIFSLHFGSFGGAAVRWSYFFLGLGGAALFYTGNLLWLETRRRKRRQENVPIRVRQSRATRVLGALTIGVSLGCVAGISLTIAAAKVLPLLTENTSVAHTSVYYASFLAAIGWALLRGVARGSVDLLVAAAIASAMIPLVSLLAALVPGFGWNHPDQSMIVDLVAAVGAAALFVLATKTAARSRGAPVDSIWYWDQTLRSRYHGEDR